MRKLFLSIMVLTTILLTSLAQAEPARRDSEEQRALAKAQHLLRELSGKRDALRTENSRLKAEIEALKRQHASTQRTVAAQRAEANEELGALSSRLDESAQALKRQEETTAALEERLRDQTQAHERCTANNAKLVGLNRELLRQYQNKGVWDALLQREPFTQLKRVEIENLSAEYTQRIGELKVSEAEDSNPSREKK